MVSRRASTSLLSGRCSVLHLDFSCSHVTTKDDCLCLGQVSQSCPSLLILWQARSLSRWCLDTFFCSSVIAEEPGHRCGEGRWTPTDGTEGWGSWALPAGCWRDMAGQGLVPIVTPSASSHPGSRSQHSPSCRQDRWHREQSQPQQPPSEPVKQLFNVSPPISPPRSTLSCHEHRVACVAEPRGQGVRAMAVGSPSLLLVILKDVHARQKRRQCLVCRQGCSVLTHTWSSRSCHKGVWTWSILACTSKFPTAGCRPTSQLCDTQTQHLNT